jgi:hypothetical protein
MSFRRVRRSLSGLSLVGGLSSSSLCGLRRGAVTPWDGDDALCFGPWRPLRFRVAFPEPVTGAVAALVPRLDVGHCVHLAWGGAGALGCVLDGPLWADEPLWVALPCGWRVDGIEVHTKVCVPEAKGGSEALWAGAVACGLVAPRRPPCLLALTHSV